jgi:hypothetical protein
MSGLLSFLSAGVPGSRLVTGVKAAVVFVGTYVAWLFAFQRAVEPALRRAASALAGGIVAWGPTSRGLRLWGLAHGRGRVAQATVSLCCALLVLGASLLPAVLLAVLSRPDPAVAASRYLASIPAAALFTFRVLSASRGRAQAPPSSGEVERPSDSIP